MAAPRLVRQAGELAIGGVALAVYAFFRVLPLDVASALGGWIGRTIGPLLSVTDLARTNLAAAMPELTVERREEILRGMWDNLGRVAGELPHVSRFATNQLDARIQTTGAESVETMRVDGKPGLIVSGHLGNWEVAPYITAGLGLPIDLVYRSANNPWVERIFLNVRGSLGGELIPKGSAGAKRLLERLKSGNHIGMLVDQKMNDGIAVPFFGRPAMTAPAVAQFAYRFECPVVMCRVVRLRGARFRMDILPPWYIEPSGDRMSDLVQFMTRVNATLEAWIRENPEQWFWVHRRWPKD